MKTAGSVEKGVITARFLQQSTEYLYFTAEVKRGQKSLRGQIKTSNVSSGTGIVLYNQRKSMEVYMSTHHTMYFQQSK